MPEGVEQWLEALNGYHYDIDLRLFAARSRYPTYFVDYIEGTRDATKRFEDHFSLLSRGNLEGWFEVVFWKMFSQKGRRDQKTLQIIENIEGSGVLAEDLHRNCSAYILHPSRSSLQALVELLWGKGSRAVAVACVFPAFIAPDQFPMVDTRVAKWVNACLAYQNASDGKGPQLAAPEYPGNGATVLTLSDWPFIESWIHWCRHTARRLTSCSDLNWRARDVEMAIFRAWGNPDERKKSALAKNRPLLDLPPLSLLEDGSAPI